MSEFSKSRERQASKPEVSQGVDITPESVFEALNTIAVSASISPVELLGNTSASHTRNGWPRALAYALCKKFSPVTTLKERDFNNMTRSVSTYHAVLSGVSLIHQVRKHGVDYTDHLYDEWPPKSVAVRDQLIALAEHVVATLPSLEELERSRRG